MHRRLFERGRQGEDRVRSFRWKALDNPHLDRQYVEAQRAELTERQWTVEWEGEFSDAADSVFRWDHIAGCIGEVPSSPIDGRRYVLGFDPAKMRDRSGLVVLDTTEIPRRVVHVEDLSGSDYVVQVARVGHLARSYGAHRVAVDATGLGEVVTELLQRENLAVTPVKLTADTKAGLVQDLAVALERHELNLPDNRALLDELKWFRAERGTGGRVKYEAAPGAKDDLVLALALALHAAGGAVGAGSFAEQGVMPFLTHGPAVGPEDFAEHAVVARPSELPDTWLPWPSDWKEL